MRYPLTSKTMTNIQATIAEIGTPEKPFIVLDFEHAVKTLAFLKKDTVFYILKKNETIEFLYKPTTA